MSSLVEVKTKITQIIQCLEDIKVASVDILKKLDPVMKALKDSNNEIVVQGIKLYPEHASTLQEAMQNITVEWIKDASSAKLEVDNFLAFNEDGIVYRFESCPFLAEVWNGDTYDKYELDGLKELLSDLKKQFSNINRQNLFSLAVKKLKE